MRILQQNYTGIGGIRFNFTGSLSKFGKMGQEMQHRYSLTLKKKARKNTWFTIMVTGNTENQSLK